MTSPFGSRRSASETTKYAADSTGAAKRPSGSARDEPGCSLGEHLERCPEALVAEHREEAVRQLAELGQGDSELALGGGELALERRIAAAELPPREPDRDAQRQQALLRPVVQVALELPALRVGGRDEPRARDAAVRAGRAAKRAGARARSRVERPRRSLREARVVEQAAAVHEHGDLAATGHHARGDAVGVTWQGRRLTLRVDPARLTVEAVEQPQRGVAESVRKLASRPPGGGEAPRSTTSRASAERARRALTRSQTTPAATSASAAISPTHSARSVGSLDRKPRSRPGAAAPKSASAAAAGTSTGAATRPPAGENRASRPQASTAKAAVQITLSSRPSCPSSCQLSASLVDEEVIGRAVEASLREWVEDRGGGQPEHPQARRVGDDQSATAGRPSGRSSGPRNAAWASSGGQTAYSTSPAVNAEPAPGLFHSKSQPCRPPRADR